MSSYKIQNKKCNYCGLNNSFGILKCAHCKLWDIGTKMSYIPKKDYLYNIKNVYVINLKKDYERMNSFFNRMTIQKISTLNRNWKKFIGIDGSKMENIIDELNLILTDMEDKKKVFSLWEKHPGSIGCFLSHIKLWKYILDYDLNSEYTLIMEDDSFFEPLGMINIEIALNNIKHLNWDILYIGHNILKGTKINPLFIKPYICKLSENMEGYNSGLFGYIIRKSSIYKLISIVKTFESPFLDVLIRNNFKKINTLFCNTHLIRHSYGKSSRNTIDNRNKIK